MSQSLEFWSEKISLQDNLLSSWTLCLCKDRWIFIVACIHWLASYVIVLTECLIKYVSGKNIFSFIAEILVKGMGNCLLFLDKAKNAWMWLHIADKGRASFWKGSVNSFPQKSTKGSVVLGYVFRHLNLVEIDYFGLRYCDRSHQTVSKRQSRLDFPSVNFYPVSGVCL